MTTPKLALTVPQAAEAAGVTDKQIRAWIGAGDLRAKRQTRRPGDGEGVGRYLILVRDLEDCLERLPSA